MQLPGARGPFEEKSGRPETLSLKLRNFFKFSVLVDRTLMGGKSQNTEFLGHFGLGQPLALREILREKRKKHNSRGSTGVLPKR